MPPCDVIASRGFPPILSGGAGGTIVDDWTANDLDYSMPAFIATVCGTAQRQHTAATEEPLKVSIQNSIAGDNNMEQALLMDDMAATPLAMAHLVKKEHNVAKKATHTANENALCRCDSILISGDDAREIASENPPLDGDDCSTFNLEASTCRWHKSASSVGIVSGDGHLFTKTSGTRKVRMSREGKPMELSAICMVFDESLRLGGQHHYTYQILDGELGAADGAGFVFDSKVRRNNIQKMRSVFLNQRGCICVRNNEHVQRLGAQLPSLGVGMSLILMIDLDQLYLQFVVYNQGGVAIGAADVSLGALSRENFLKADDLRSGFFCAVVTKEVCVGLQ